MAREDEAVAAALTTLLRTVRDAEDLLAGAIDEAGDFEASSTTTRAMAAMIVRLHGVIADGHRALREKHLAMANAADENEEWGLAARGATA
jgi:hypothetical protein